MSALLVIAALAQVKPGPTDAFRANLAAARVKVYFKCDFFDRVDFSAVARQLERFQRGLVPAGDPAYIARGRWDFDGSCEHYVVDVTGGSRFDSKSRRGPFPPSELIWDGDTYAYHYLLPGESILHVEVRMVEPPLAVAGPFTCKSNFRLDKRIDAIYGTAEIERKTGERSGHRVEVEVYKTVNAQKFQSRLEIAYDPEFGYVPRFVREIVYGVEDGRSAASVREMYLTDVAQCGAGAFVPTEWYLIQYHIVDFESKYAGYNDETRLVPSDKPRLTHFKVEEMKDQKGPVALDEMGEVRRILGPGGSYSGNSDLSHLTLAALKNLLGKKLTPLNKPILPNIDVAELHEFDQSPGRSPWFTCLLCVLVAAALVWCLRAWRRGAAFLVLLSLIVTGCGYKPIPILTTAISPERIVYDASSPSLSLDLIVTNAGNRTLKISQVDGGCSCRQVDRTTLPARLEPGEQLRLSLKMSAAPAYDSKTYRFTFGTDHGQLSAQAPLVALPDHSLSPQSITLNSFYEGVEESEEVVELVHREVYSPGKLREKTELTVPAEFVAQKIAGHSGRVAASPEYAFEDTTFRLKLTDRTLGLHRGDVFLRGEAGKRIAGVPIVWQRLPFLSSTPSRVILSTLPARAFLHCPDQRAELVRVLSAPNGVKAVVSSPREVLISTIGDAPGVIEGFVEVETTLNGRDPLRIPVVRYAPVASRH